MTDRMDLSDACFVGGFGEYGFGEIVDDFENAEKILIVTYNLSDNFLIKKLKELEQSTEIIIFTNIPGRFPSYYDEDLQKRARQKIQRYLEKLHPDNLGENIHVYFSFDNHSKIIATDFSAYVGSANYSDASKNNYEAGIITQDSKFLKYLFGDCLTKLYRSSVPYSAHEYIVVLKEFRDYIEDKRVIYAELVDSCYSYYDDYMGMDHRYYLGEETCMTQDTVDKTIDYENARAFLLRLCDTARRVGCRDEQRQLLDDSLSSLDNLLTLSQSENLQKLIRFDLDKRTNQLYNEKDLMGDSGPEVCLEAQNEAFEEKREIAEYAEVEVQNFIKELRKHHELLRNAFFMLKDRICEVSKVEADNT